MTITHGREHAEHTAKGLSSWTRDGQRGGALLKMATVGAAGFAAGVVVLGARKLAMQGMTAIAGDWFRQLKVEHKLAEALFETGLRTKTHETGKRTAILAHLAYALLKHGLQEETAFTQPCGRWTKGRPPKPLRQSILT